MAQWFAQVDGQRYGPASEEEMKSWVAQGRVKPTDYVWAEGMPSWVTAGSAFGIAAGAPSNAGEGQLTPVASDASLAQTEYLSPTERINAPGAISSMVCGIVGTVVSFMCCGGIGTLIFTVAGLTMGIVALVLAKKAKALQASDPALYGGQGQATAGRILGIIAICLTALKLVIVIVAVIFVGATMSHLFRF